MIYLKFNKYLLSIHFNPYTSHNSCLYKLFSSNPFIIIIFKLPVLMDITQGRNVMNICILKGCKYTTHVFNNLH
jgi:hypothetical protein